MRTPHALVAGGVLLLLSTVACAQNHSRHDGQPPAPSPEAIAACKGQAAGATVSFTGRRGDTVTGTCQQVGDVLAARPSGRPHGGAADGGSHDGGSPPAQ